MTTNGSTYSVSKMVEGKITWALKNWKICHSFLASHTSCILHVGDVSLRFYLKPLEEKYHLKDNAVEYMRFYSLFVELLSGQESLFLYVHTEIVSDPRLEMAYSSSHLPNSQVLLERSPPGCSAEFLVQKRFLYMGSYQVDIWRKNFGNRNFFEDVNELKIKFTVKIFLISCAQSVSSSHSVNDAQARSLADDMKNLYIGLSESDNCCHDVELKMEDGTIIPASRVVLAARSPVFRAMFTSGMKESFEKVVPIKKIGSKAMYIVLKYMYTDEISDNWGECAAEVVEAASMYDLPELLKFYDKNLMKICNVNNALELYKLAKLYNLETAMGQLTEFTKTNTAEVLLNIET